MATTIVTKNSSTAAAVPTAGQLVQGELAVNVVDKRLFTEDNGGTIVEVGTNPSTLTVTGEITANGGIALGDNDKATFGAGDDLQIYHDGSHSYVSDQGTGNIKILADDFILKNSADTETMIQAFTDSSVSLWHDNAAKLATTSTGIDVTGTATMEGLTVDGNSRVNGDFTIDTAPRGFSFASSLEMGSGGSLAVFGNANTSLMSNVYFASDATYKVINTGYSAAVHQLFGGSHLFSTASAAGTAGSSIALYTRMSIAKTGDVSFYEDTGTTPKFFWDASAESLGIGGAATDGTFQVKGTGVNTGITNVLIDASFSDASNGTGLLIGHRTDETTAVIAPRTATGNLAFYNYDGGWSESVRISSAGHTTFGTTDLTPADNSVNGTSILSDGRINHNAQSQPAAVIGRTGTDGTIIDLRKNGTSVGSIQSRAGLLTTIILDPRSGQGAGLTGAGAGGDTLRHITPTNESGVEINGKVSLGNSNNGFKDFYLSGSVVAGNGATNAATLNAYSKTVSTNLPSALRVIENTSASSYWDIGSTGGSLSNNLNFYSNANITPKMTITGAGNVGIGVTPLELLHIQSDTTSPAMLVKAGGQGGSTTPTAELILSSGSLSSNDSACKVISYRIGDYSVASLRTSGLKFQTTNANAPVDAMSLDNSGNLQLSGKVIAGAGENSNPSITSHVDTNTGLFFGGGDILGFSTGGAERMRLDGSGNLLVGTTSTIPFLFTSGSGAGITSSGTIMGAAAAEAALFNRVSGDGAVVSFFRTGTGVGNISVGPGSTSYNTSSDQRLKENIADADDAGSKIDAIQVRQYDWKADGSHQDYGMVAQELLEVAPEAVYQPEDSEDMMGVDYSKLVPMLIKEIQSLRNRVAQLEG